MNLHLSFRYIMSERMTWTWSAHALHCP